MSTATNLLSLLNQLQLMENSLTNFMLETILKIQSLTETKVFLLLESPGGSDGGRRYCGTRDLVELFENGRLASRTADLEVSLDPSIHSLVEKNRLQTDEPTGERQRGVKKRAIDNSSRDDSVAVSSVPPIKRLRVEESDGLVTFAEEMAAGPSEEEGKEEPVKREVEEYVIGDSDDEEDRSGLTMSLPNVNVSNGAFHQAPMTSISSICALEDGYDDMPQYRPSNELCGRKMEALQSIENASAVFEKGSLENKLLSSILYDYGKELALKCPYEDVTLGSAEVKSYFYGNLEQFLSHFQRFTIEKTIVSELLKTQSPQSYMRNIARSGYKAAAKTVMKKRNSCANGN